MTDQCYYRLFGEEFGPVSRSVIDAMVEGGQLGEQDEIRLDGDAAWSTVGQLVIAQPNRSTTRASVEGGTVMSLDSMSDVNFETVTDQNGSASGSGKPAAAEGWFYQTLGQEFGPFSFEELLEHARRGDLSPDDQIRTGSQGKWRRAGSMGRLMAVMPYQQPTAPSPKPSAEASDDEFETRIVLRDSSLPAPEPAAVVPRPPNPLPPSPPLPPPPPPPPPPPAPIPAYNPYGAGYGAPGWGVPQPMMPPAPVVDQGWYAWVGGVECGPMEMLQLANWGQSGRLTSQDYIKQGKYSQWVLANTVPGLIPVAVAPPPAPPPAPVAAPAPAAAPPPKPQLKLPPPRPAPVAAALKPPVEEKPYLPPDAPPERPPSGWDTSSTTSSFGGGSYGGMGSSSPGMNRSFTPPKKSPPARGKKKSSGGGSMDVGELMKDKRVLGGVGGVLLILLLYFGWGMLPEGSGKLVTAHNELVKISKKVEDTIKANPGEKDWKDFGKKMKKETANAVKPISTSKQHAAWSSVTAVKSAIDMVLGKKTPKDAEERLKDIEKKIDAAKKKLGI